MTEFAFRTPIQTERLLLRPFEESDFDAVFGMQSRPDVARYLYWDPRDEDAVRVSLQKKIASTALHGQGDALFLAVVLRSSGEVVGDVDLEWLSADHDLGEIGYIVHPDHAGNGYATEAAAPLLRVAFEQVGLHRVVGCVEARNAASARVLEKLGMRLEAHLLENEWVKGEWQSELVYAILDQEWRAART